MHKQERAWTDAVTVLARKIARRANQKERHLSEQKKFYVYALLDPRKPGPWVYSLQGGKQITFSYQPFYIGKGTNERMYLHAWEAQHKTKRSYKLNKIRKIQAAGFEVIEQQISDFSKESVAFAKEALLIDAIGLFGTQDSPLTNLTEGGYGGGSRGALRREANLTEEQRARKSAKCRKYALLQNAVLTAEQLQARALKGTRIMQSSPEARRKLSERQRATQNARTPEQVEQWADKFRMALASKPKVICPHCKVQGTSGGNMKRYHFDNCRSFAT